MQSVLVRSLPVIMLALLVGGCEQTTLVDFHVITTYRAGADFSDVTVEMDGVVQRRSPTLYLGDVFPQEVVRVTFESTPERHYHTVSLVRATGETLAVQLETHRFVSGVNSVEVYLLRGDCEGVDATCATSGQRCMCGECEPAGCADEPTLTGGECRSSCCTLPTDCPAAREACASAACIEGRCTVVPVVGACRDPLVCDPELGCVLLDGPRDAGSDAYVRAVDAGDAGDACAGCNDGDACNGVEECLDGACRPGTAMICDDHVGCTRDSCRASHCVFTPDDTLCSAASMGHCNAASGCQYPTCTAATCVAGPCETASCSGSTCVRTSLCSAAQSCCAGACVVAGCDDGNVCTTDSCSPASGCQHVNNVVTCSDGNMCTTGESCRAGACGGGAAVSCASANPCVSGSCSPSTGCTYASLDGVPCTSDGMACTADICSLGTCSHVTCPGAPLMGPITTRTCCGGSSGSCVDLNTDVSNCGACGVRCGANEWCAPGMTVGPPPMFSAPRCRCDGGAFGSGQPACRGTTPNCCSGTGCVNLATDQNNCGTCGRACGGTSPTCVAGNCV